MVEYAKVQENKTTGQKFVNISKSNKNLVKDDWVKIVLMPKEEGGATK